MLQAQSPTLTSLEIGMPRTNTRTNPTGSPPVVLSTLFRPADTAAQVHDRMAVSGHLERLKIYNNVLLTPSCIPLLRSLTYLNLSVGSTTPPPSFWKALESAGVRLRNLHTETMEDCIAQYALSYSGLVDLGVNRLAESKEKDSGEASKLAHLFYHSVIPKHAASLKFLTMKSREAEPWGITKANLEPILQCRDLRRLNLIYPVAIQSDGTLLPPFSLVGLSKPFLM